MPNQNLSELNKNEIKNEIFRLQNWVEVEKSNGLSIDELLDNSIEFERFENYFTEEEYSIFILTILNNFKSAEIIDMLVNAISNIKEN
jgi:hypothetical protein